MKDIKKRITKTARTAKTSLRNPQSRRFNLYLSVVTYEAFKRECERLGYPASAVAEQLMAAFLKR